VRAWIVNQNHITTIWFKNNAKNTIFVTHFSTHSHSLVKIQMGPAKFKWDPHDLVGHVNFNQ
jgi:hypothetical protein